MKKLSTRVSLLLKKNPKMLVLSVSLMVGLGSLLLYSYSSGPAAGGLARTGAPFNNNLTCNGCHNGGNFGASINLQLYDLGNNLVTKYVPGQTYTYRISLSHTAGSPQYGFQATAATQAGSVNINTWGTLPASVQNSPLNNRNYIEHSDRLGTNVIDLPWTGPAAGTGAVVFYTAGNFVNGNFGTSGDQVVNSSLTVTEETNLPVRLLYFTGSLQDGRVQLSWAAASETGSKSYTVEKSVNGQTFSAIATIASQNSSNAQYSYTDASFNGNAYYRLLQTDLDGKTTTFNIVRLKKAGTGDYTLSFAAHAGFNRLIFTNDMPAQKIQVRITDLQGKTLYATSSQANTGKNIIPLPSYFAKGLVLVSVLTADGRRTTTKALVGQ